MATYYVNEDTVVSISNDDSEWIFDAPTYKDLTLPPLPDDGADEWFEKKASERNEKIGDKQQMHNKNTTINEMHTKDERKNTFDTDVKIENEDNEVSRAYVSTKNQHRIIMETQQSLHVAANGKKTLDDHQTSKFTAERRPSLVQSRHGEGDICMEEMNDQSQNFNEERPIAAETNLQEETGFQPIHQTVSKQQMQSKFSFTLNNRQTAVMARPKSSTLDQRKRQMNRPFTRSQSAVKSHSFASKKLVQPLKTSVRRSQSMRNICRITRPVSPKLHTSLRRNLRLKNETKQISATHERTLSSETNASMSRKRSRSQSVPRLMSGREPRCETVVQKKPRLTKPQSPKLSTAQRKRQKIQISSDDLDLQRIHRNRLQIRRQATIAVSTLSSIKEMPPVRRTIKLTEPQEFHFATDSRIRRGFRQDTEHLTPNRQQTTSLFKFGTLTKPQPFSLRTSTRSRPDSHILSREEREWRELQSIPKFKAQPVNESILRSRGDIGVPRVEKPETTRPIEFHLLSDTRKRSHVDVQVQKPHGFKALPMPDFDVIPEEDNDMHVKNQNPVRHVAPFHLSTTERGEQKRLQLEARLLQEMEQARRAREFHAQPLRLVEPKPLVHEIRVTESMPFHLRTDEIGDKIHARFLQQLNEERQRDEEQRRFHAQELPDLSKVFRVRSLNRQPVTPMDIVLKSDQRFEQRKQFDEYIQQKELQRLEQDAELERQRAEQERAEIAELRKKLIHKPLPLPGCLDHPEFVPNKSNVPLTEPFSPLISKSCKRTATMQAIR